MLAETNLLTVYATPMLNNKYYTPALNDFYIGYHFEILEDFDYYPDKSWHPFTYGEGSTTNIENMQSPLAIPEKDWGGKIRTRCLDRIDIESLGWGHHGKSVYGYWYSKTGDFTLDTWTSYKLLLHHVESEGRVYIYAEDIDNKEILFRGLCPSINELRTIKKLLGI